MSKTIYFDTRPRNPMGQFAPGEDGITPDSMARAYGPGSIKRSSSIGSLRATAVTAGAGAIGGVGATLAVQKLLRLKRGAPPVRGFSQLVNKLNEFARGDQVAKIFPRSLVEDATFSKALKRDIQGFRKVTGLPTKMASKEVAVTRKVTANYIKGQRRNAREINPQFRSRIIEKPEPY